MAVWRLINARVHHVWACLLVLALILSSCDNKTGWFKDLRSKRDKSNPSFDEGANRPPTAETLYATSRILAGQGRDAECEALLKRVIGLNPRFMPAYCELAELQMRNGRVNDAIRTLAAGLRVSPRDAVLLNNLGMCWIMKGNYSKALEMFTQAAGSMPRNARYRANAAVALGMLGRYEESLSLFKQVVTPAEAHHNLAVICEARKDTVRAAKEYDRASALWASSRGSK